jgi:hypothetical protein
MKTIISSILVAVGLFVLSVWASGTHGHIMFRPHMMEDWILAVTLLICFGIPLLQFLKWLIRIRRQSSDN